VSDRNLIPDAEEFVAQAVESIQQVEVLLLLRGTSERWWTAKEIARELGVSETAVDYDALALRARGLFAKQRGRPSSYRYEPKNIHLLAGVESIAAVYRDRPLIVAKAIANRLRRG
jgi:biotin operon repressor